MPTVNSSVPDHVRRAFNEMFEGRNKSAVIAELMIRAVEEERQKARRARAMRDLIARREERPVTSGEQVLSARPELRGRP